MTVTWTLSCEVMLYLAFPWLVRMRWPAGTGKLLVLLVVLWVVGMIPHSIYILHDPDHVGHMADRYTDGFWINTLKYTPFPYVCTFLAGLTLGRLHSALQLTDGARAWVGLAGFSGVLYAAYELPTQMPYILVHGGLLTPLFAMIILGCLDRAGWAASSRGDRWWRLGAQPTACICCTSMYFSYCIRTVSPNCYMCSGSIHGSAMFLSCCWLWRCGDGWSIPAKWPLWGGGSSGRPPGCRGTPLPPILA